MEGDVDETREHILAHLLQHDGATLGELAEVLKAAGLACSRPSVSGRIQGLLREGRVRFQRLVYTHRKGAPPARYELDPNAGTMSVLKEVA